MQGLRLTIIHKLMVVPNQSLDPASSEPRIMTETIAEDWFKNKDFLFDCGEERTTTVNMIVPVSDSR